MTDNDKVREEFERWYCTGEDIDCFVPWHDTLDEPQDSHAVFAWKAWKHQKSIIESLRRTIDELRKEVKSYYGGKLEVILDGELLEATYEQADEGGTSGWCIDTVPRIEQLQARVSEQQAKIVRLEILLGKKQNQLEQSQARVKELEYGLLKYGDHIMSCREEGSCICGYHELITPPGEPKP